MGKYISGTPTKASLEQWADYCSRNTQVNARHANNEPTAKNPDPDQVRYHKPSGRVAPDADAGLVVKSGGHKFPEIKAGGCSGEGRIQLSNAQARKR
jgi:hypothetical protein